MYEQVQFAAAHRLRGYEGKCENLHGHNYKVELVVGCEDLNGTGMVMDFQDLKKIADEVIARFDHRYLNELEPFDTANPTTEHIARHIADELATRLPRGVRVREVSCRESDRCGASYIPDQAPCS